MKPKMRKLYVDSMMQPLELSCSPSMEEMNGFHSLEVVAL